MHSRRGLQRVCPPGPIQAKAPLGYALWVLSGQGAAEGLKGSGVWEKRAKPERGDRKRAKSGTIPVQGLGP